MLQALRVGPFPVLRPRKLEYIYSLDIAPNTPSSTNWNNNFNAEQSKAKQTHNLISFNLKMFTKTAIISLLAALTAVAPTRRGADPNKFTVITSHSGDNQVHLRNLNANGGSFYINKATSTNCVPQEGIDCSTLTNSTVFSFQSKSLTLEFDEVVGGQYI